MHNNNKELTLSAPLSGPVLTLAKVPDPVFASGAMGDGIAIDPLNDTLHAPARAWWCMSPAPVTR